VPLTIRDFEVRDFQPADFDTLWRIDQECFPPGISYSRTELKVYLRRRGAFALVAVSTPEQNTDAARTRSRETQMGHSSDSAGDTDSSGRIAGFIVAEVERGAGHIITIDVVASARRHGIGSLLLGSAEERLRDADCRLVELETAVDNSSALSFYKRHSYTVVETVSGYYSNGVDALVLQKPFVARVDRDEKIRRINKHK
jgi:[ribosomal protein S18]-alanine N-acetyltransferase